MPHFTFFNNSLSGKNYLLGATYSDTDLFIQNYITNCNASIVNSTDEFPSWDNLETMMRRSLGMGDILFLSREKSLPIETIFEACIVHVFKSVFDPWDVEDTWWYRGIVDVTLILYMIMLLGPLLFMIGIGLEECYRFFSETPVQQPRQVIAAVDRPLRILYNAVSPINIQLREWFADSRSFKQRLALLLQRDIALHVPEELRCPISHEIMNDPITTSIGITYDRIELAREFARQGDPLTILYGEDGLSIADYEYKNFLTNVKIKAKIRIFLEKTEAKFSSELVPNSAQVATPVRNYSSFVAPIIPRRDLLPTERIQLLENDDPDFMDIPDSIKCPITTNVMDNPITLPSGITIDKQNFAMLFGRAANANCPITRISINRAQVESFKTNVTIQKWTEEFITKAEQAAIEREQDQLNEGTPQCPSFEWVRSYFPGFFRRGYFALPNADENIVAQPTRRNTY